MFTVRPSKLLARIAIGVLWALSAPLVALAQTTSGHVDAIDPTPTLIKAALFVLPIAALLVLLLFEPWNWGKNIEKRRRRKGKPGQKDTADR